MNNNILEIKKINKNFQHRNGLIEIFKNVTLNVKKGDLVALIGPSGSGKSTLLNMISLIDSPTSGQIIFNNKDMKDLNEENKNNIRKKYISMIFQDNNLLTDFTALENVLMPLIIKEEKIKLSRKKAEKILASFNLKSRQNHYPDELSGGEQQRVAIARALISETDLILADEPTGNLDYKTSQEIFSYFLKLKKLNKTIIFATHNRDLANKADYKLSILDGNIKRANV
jgi:ABC-type lipoprotein export system ATPase subunit|tara:strand:- start:1171 stop:1854 length:684 start_codon:yes stop_codon:yes gene_type:complete